MLRTNCSDYISWLSEYHTRHQVHSKSLYCSKFSEVSLHVMKFLWILVLWLGQGRIEFEDIPFLSWFEGIEIFWFQLARHNNLKVEPCPANFFAKWCNWAVIGKMLHVLGPCDAGYGIGRWCTVNSNGFYSCPTCWAKVDPQLVWKGRCWTPVDTVLLARRLNEYNNARIHLCWIHRHVFNQLAVFVAYLTGPEAIE